MASEVTTAGTLLVARCGTVVNSTRGALRSSVWLPTIAILVTLVAFEVIARSEVLTSRQYLPPVSEIAIALARLAGSGLLWLAIGNTLLSVAIGLSIAILIAIPLGVLIGSSAIVDRATRVIIEFLRPVPSVALIPLAVLVYGNGIESKVFLIVFASVWPILIQTVYGIRDIDPVAIETARSFGFSTAQRLVKVSLRAAVPYMATGLRVSFAVALILAVTAELIIGNPGLGKEISLARQVSDIQSMYALIIATGIVGWGLNTLIAHGER